MCFLYLNFQITAFRLFGTNPLSKPIMVHYQLGPRRHVSMEIYSNSILMKKIFWKVIRKLVAILTMQIINIKARKLGELSPCQISCDKYRLV